MAIHYIIKGYFVNGFGNVNLLKYAIIVDIITIMFYI